VFCRYKVEYKRIATLGGFKVSGLFKVINPHTATLSLNDISYSISRSTGEPITGEASCSGTMDDAYDSAAAEAKASTSGSINPHLSAQLQPQAAQASSSSSSAAPAVLMKAPKKIKMAAVKYVKVKRQAKGLAVATVQYEDTEEVEYEEGGHGPLFCTFEANLPDDHPAQVTLTVVTDEGAKVTESLGVIDWSGAETREADK
jgi:hypothetical protein